ncbi:hypothetical protein [Actinokineospora sp. NBRC 105648]|uniref:hypothetical protein n=1 Tax=Actinokineospora sp. NBRC 105648 TaxID=3032206 RepID=UPI0024A319F9|nr:hypothetical protein [Actinokineospora sp. NBRC 105648]GLZ39925.1 hypothetical protein Acsp05_35490 [Actinokineospora sp. NBRC 105648]
MSEYQYYEFRAVDEPLSEQQLGEVRALSTRAEITPTSFVNEYHRGDFRGDPRDLVERYYDAFLYYANWGTRTLVLRLPKKLLEPSTATRYGVDTWTHKGDVLVSLGSDDENADFVDQEFTLDALIEVRDEIAAGDTRPFYLDWLGRARIRLDEDTALPPPPAGLDALSDAQQTLAEFLRVDDELLAAVYGDPRPRRVDDLLQAAQQQRDERDHRARLAQARQVELERVQVAEAAARRAERLRGKEGESWAKVMRLVATYSPKDYDSAVALLGDLHELSRRSGDQEEFFRRCAHLRAEFARRPAFIRRLDEAGLPG